MTGHEHVRQSRGSGESAGLKEWSVGGAVIVRNDRVLLVQNQRRNGELDWSTPGGVIDEGESVLGGLGREVTEETGIEVHDWRGPLYRVEVTAPGFGFFLQAEAHLALASVGDVAVDDPDRIVVGAEFVTLELARIRLESAPIWVAEPLLAHLFDGVDDGRLFAYRLDGSSPGDRRVVRLAP